MSKYTIKENWTNTISVTNTYDDDKNPSGGSIHSVGMDITWRNGPLGDGGPADTNGAFVEDVILAAIERLKFFQLKEDGTPGKFSCRENAYALTHLEEALMWIQRRHENRTQRGVQGTHQV